MNRFLALIVGLLLGSALTYALVRKEPATDYGHVLYAASRNTLVDSDIDALDMIREGDVQSAELMLAAAVNSQILVIDKLSSSSTDDKALSADWRKRMMGHNDRLGLALPTREK